MTRQQLHRENEALHELLAFSCEALEMIANYEPLDAFAAMKARQLAQDTLDQIKEWGEREDARTRPDGPATCGPGTP